MFEAIAEAIKGLSAYPIIQAILSIVTIFGMGAMVVRKGERDRRSVIPQHTNGSMPNWLLYGPVAEAINIVRDLAEQSRVGNDLLRQMIVTIDGRTEEMRNHRELLEDIRNLLEQRYDPSTAHPPPRPKR